MEVKAPGAFRTISEVATSLEVPQHVLRFWESKFQQVRPLKRGGGRRYYRREDVELLESIKDLLYNQGFTIRGVQKLLKENSRRATIVRPSAGEGAGTLVAVAPALQAPVAQTASSLGFSTKARREIESVLGELKTLRSILSQSGV
ncbi:MAG: MerR family transcriptional regulator [Alphaproteobacteria bacterium]|nr:MerR family transcriptional regulator [Alphaproteobacteria bacterium]